MKNSESHDRLVGEFAGLVNGDNAQFSLSSAAFLIAKENNSELQTDLYERELSRLSNGLVEAIGLDTLRYNARRIIRSMSVFIFRECGFVPDLEFPDDPLNIYLDTMLDRKTGVAISLTLLYCELGRRAGLDIRPVGLPGNMICRFYPSVAESDLEQEVPEILIDPYAAGKNIRRQDAHILIRNRFGGRIRLEDHYFDPLEPRQFMQRLLRLLKTIYLQRGDEERAARIIDFLVAMYPWDLDEMRDRGMLRAKTDDTSDAISDLEPYLRYRPHARDVGTIREIVLSLKEHVQLENDSAMLD
jgi:regulator of sirC expression with transglutaminase-like and TPR domain